MKISKAYLYKYDIPLLQKVWVGIQQIDKREGLILRVEDENNDIFYTEISPLSGLDVDGESLQWMPNTTLYDIIKWFNEEFQGYLETNIINKDYPSLKFALSSLPLLRKDSYIITKPSIPLLSTDMDDEEIAFCLKDNPFFVKVKVGKLSIRKEIEFIYNLLKINKDLKFRLDANQQFSFDDAFLFLGSIPKDSIDYIEEPCKTIKENITLFKVLSISFALDESITSEYQFKSLLGLKALIIKPTSFGDISRLIELIKEASSYGVDVILSSSYESTIGTLNIQKIASIITPSNNFGVDTLRYFSKDLIFKQDNKPCIELNELELIWQYGS